MQNTARTLSCHLNMLHSAYVYWILVDAEVGILFFYAFNLNNFRAMLFYTCFDVISQPRNGFLDCHWHNCEPDVDKRRPRDSKGNQKPRIKTRWKGIDSMERGCCVISNPHFKSNMLDYWAKRTETVQMLTDCTVHSCVQHFPLEEVNVRQCSIMIHLDLTSRS